MVSLSPRAKPRTGFRGWFGPYIKSEWTKIRFDCCPGRRPGQFQNRLLVAGPFTLVVWRNQPEIGPGNPDRGSEALLINRKYLVALFQFDGFRRDLG